MVCSVHLLLFNILLLSKMMTFHFDFDFAVIELGFVIGISGVSVLNDILAGSESNIES